MVGGLYGRITQPEQTWCSWSNGSELLNSQDCKTTIAVGVADGRAKKGAGELQSVSNGSTDTARYLPRTEHGHAK